MPTPPRLMTMTDDERAAALAGPPEKVAPLLLEAAEAGHGEAQLLGGQICLDGQGVPRDPVAALRWFGLAAQGGNAMAMNMVGRCCEHGWGTGVDKVLAAQWYGAAADQGLDWGLYNLATLHALGDGVPQDRPKALDLFQRAATMGHAKSINMIGSFYEDGWVVVRDMEQAAGHYRRAAEKGDFRGQFNHARMLMAQGDQDAARLWLTRMEETATPAFLAKARHWIDEASRPMATRPSHPAARF